MAQAAVWGLVRTAQAENPGRFTLIDIDGSEGGARALAAALAAEEPQLAVRDGRALVARLRRAVRRELPVPEAPAWRLETGGDGTLDGLALVPHEEALRPLAEGEIRVGIRAAGLNFRDVVVALGLVPGLTGLGGEAAGVVLETGPGVTGFAVGDRVMGLVQQADAYGPVAVADSRTLARIPDGWTFAQAASVPAVFLTAYHALVELAGLKAGETVLIHAATGGVGMAAVQLARHLGAEVYATASRPKWPTLRAMGFDDTHIASSRDLDFEKHILDVTGGKGVDVVLDSLAGEFVDASLRALGDSGGRFVEMGKTDIRDPKKVADRHPGVDYRAFDLQSMEPEHLQAMFGELMRLFEAGGAHPAPADRLGHPPRPPEAFRHVSQARHTGKVVLTLPRPIDPHGTALITGATGTLGRLVARHLVTHHHIRHLLLTGRRGLDADGMPELVTELENHGATVTVEALDITDHHTLTTLLDNLTHPLTLVVHTAGLIDDGILAQQTPDRLHHVWQPKTHAAHHLHHLTTHHDLAHFVLFSSIAGTLGNAGQANYAAANAALDALAHHRHHQGLPALSLAWGLWAEASGMTGHLGETELRRMARDGVGALGAEEGWRSWTPLSAPPCRRPWRQARRAASGARCRRCCAAWSAVLCAVPHAPSGPAAPTR
ncbi:SDR family NAD(P)-dependent oxidoreductase [Streptomyces thermocoprophilus]|uniref:MDR/SDR family oxidoreductase n=1 Tax=Streptomyces thermocoprophilus TaxID=78356 RepID=UPI003610B5F2